MGNLPKDVEEYVNEIFELLDMDKDGYISFNEYKQGKY